MIEKMFWVGFEKKKKLFLGIYFFSDNHKTVNDFFVLDNLQTDTNIFKDGKVI